MRVAILLMAALGACSSFFGPSESDLRGAVDAFTHPQDDFLRVAVQEFEGAQLESVERCDAVGATFMCSATMRLATGAEVEVDVWVMQSPIAPSGWRVQSIVPKAGDTA